MDSRRQSTGSAHGLDGTAANNTLRHTLITSPAALREQRVSKVTAMTAGMDEITQSALTLPADQRAQVANALLASLDDPADSAEVHEAWTEEITSRIDDITSGRIQTIPYDEVKAWLAADRAARR